MQFVLNEENTFKLMILTKYLLQPNKMLRIKFVITNNHNFHKTGKRQKKKNKKRSKRSSKTRSQLGRNIGVIKEILNWYV